MTNARSTQSHQSHQGHHHNHNHNYNYNHNHNHNQNHHHHQIHPVRRSSYASVLSGAANDSFAPQHSGALAHLLQPAAATPSTSLPPSLLYQPDADMQLSYGGATSAGRRSGGLPAYSRQFAHIPEYAGYPPASSSSSGVAVTSSPATVLPDQHSSFFTPSYLQSSRYISRLESARRARQLAARRESSTAPSLSASSSHVNLHRLAASQRPFLHDAVEKELADQPPPLPTRWNEGDKHNGLDLNPEGSEVRYSGHQHKIDHEAASVRADHPMPREAGMYYYETTILAKPKDAVIAIGFSSSRSSLERLPGWDSESWAYHGDDGKAFIGESQGQGRAFGPTFGLGDTIGCGVNFVTGTCFFTKNGHSIGTAFRDLQTSRNVNFYPAIGVKRHPHMHIRTNFGQQPFMFDIDSTVNKEKNTILSEVDNTSIAGIQPPLDEVTLLQELVAQFLSQDGYYETARAFAEEVRQETGSFEDDKSRPVFQYQQEQDVDATNRQKIRTAILEGDIDRALKYTNAYFSQVLQDNPSILFKLRCRKFLEMMCKCSDLSSTTSKRSARNGVSHHEEVFEQDMELDEHMHDDDDGFSETDGMDTAEETDSIAKFQELLTEAVQYGQQLRMDYPTDEQGGDKQYLEDIFSLMAYPDPRTSVHGHYLDASGRTAVADELNSAILVSLGKSSSAALETLYSQTEVLINELSEGGGVGAFINIQGDFLS